MSILLDNHLDGLLSAINCDAVKLDELYLSSCSLPTTALRHLATIVAASSETLQRLDLQGNGWDLSTEEALRDWEKFLTSFKNCVKMRKVDFSDNRLGDKGIETLLRVYTREMADVEDEEEEVEEMFGEPMVRSNSKRSTQSSEEDEEEAITMGASFDYGTSPTTSLAESALIKSNRRQSDMVAIPTHGLRSIAYIHLNNVGMTDLSALHLTYLLPYHQLPHVLLRRLDTQIPDPTTGREDILYNPESFCRGVMYDIDNPEFSPLGKKILESVEKVRRAGGIPLPLPQPISPLNGHSGSVPPSPDSFRDSFRVGDSPKGYFPETPSPIRKESVSSIRAVSASHGRSGSIVSVSSSKFDIQCHMTDILKARPKIQGEILKISGTLHISQLWSAAIKLLSLGRMFTISPPPKPLLKNVGVRSRGGKSKYAVKVSLPPSPVSPVSPWHFPKLERSELVGGLKKELWMKVLLLAADPGQVLSERQAMTIIDWAADKTTLAKEAEWAGKLPHVQMWKLLDVISSP
jgi:hypothetical protein